jgi:hypothetical protein
MRISFNADVFRFVILDRKNECLASVNTEETAMEAKKMYEAIEDEYYNSTDYAGEQMCEGSWFTQKYL